MENHTVQRKIVAELMQVKRMARRNLKMWQEKEQEALAEGLTIPPIIMAEVFAELTATHNCAEIARRVLYGIPL